VPGNGLHLYCLTGQHAIIWVIACSLICNKYLAYGEGTRLYYYNIIAATRDHGMAIITLDLLYFMLSCRLAPTDAPRHMGDVCAEKLWAPWSGHIFLQEWARKPFGLGSWWDSSVPFGPGSWWDSGVRTPATW
jgi:hypothetical protein